MSEWRIILSGNEAELGVLSNALKEHPTRIANSDEGFYLTDDALNELDAYEEVTRAQGR